VIPISRRKPPNDRHTSDEHNNNTLKSFEREALQYLRNKQVARGGKGLEDSRVLRMVNALACTHEPSISEKGFRGLLSSEPQSPAISLAPSNDESQGLVPAPALEGTSSHLCRLFRLHQNVESSAHLHGLALRILKVLIHHQFKLLKAAGIDNEAQEEEMLRRTGVSLEKSEDLRTRASGWLRFMSVLGVGALGIVKAQADDE
jgi:hypothetical protein